MCRVRGSSSFAMPLLSMAPARRRRHHVWVDRGKGGTHPGLVLRWRKADREGSTWEAYVAVVHGNSVLTSWIPQSDLRPITDDSWR